MISVPVSSKTRDYAMPSVGFCEKSNRKCGLLGGGPAERESAPGGAEN